MSRFDDLIKQADALEQERVELTAERDRLREALQDLQECASQFQNEVEDRSDERTYEAISRKLWNRLSGLIINSRALLTPQQKLAGISDGYAVYEQPPATQSQKQFTVQAVNDPQGRTMCISGTLSQKPKIWTEENTRNCAVPTEEDGSRRRK